MCVCSLDTGPSRSPLGKSPRLCADHLFPRVSGVCPCGNQERPKTYLSFAVRPKVDAQPHDLVDGGVRALVRQGGGEGREREESQAGFEAAVKAGAGEEGQRPLPCEEDDAKDQVDGLQHWYRLDGRIQRLGGKVPKDLGPEVAFYRGSDLVWSPC